MAQTTVNDQLTSLSKENVTKLNEIAAMLKADTISKSEAFRRMAKMGLTYYAIAAVVSKAVGKKVPYQFVYGVLGSPKK